VLLTGGCILAFVSPGGFMADTAHQLFEHHIRDMYDAEQKLVRALKRMAKNASNRELAKGFTAHARTTQRQVRRLEQVFKRLGRKARRQPCAGVDGLIEEYATFVREEEPSDEVLDAFAAEAGLKVEHYEIVAYKGLIDLANQLGLKNEAGLLKETLKEEEETASELEAMSKSLGKLLPIDEEQETPRGTRSWTAAFTSA
jgi:ferritin-like metal-binding protein YciE